MSDLLSSASRVGPIAEGRDLSSQYRMKYVWQPAAKKGANCDICWELVALFRSSLVSLKSY